jgi:putative aldouronate transport system permease protein
MNTIMLRETALQGETRFQRFRRLAWKSRAFYVMLIAPMLYFIIFEYLPFYGIVIAFQDYNIYAGFWKSPWVGFKHFMRFFSNPYSYKLIRNTFLISFYTLLFGFPAPIILALLLNEIKVSWFKKITQTISYLPHFISTVVICGIIVNFLKTDGIVNQIITAFGRAPIPFMMKASWFRTIYVVSDIWQSVGWGSIIYLAAIAGINPELYEAATIDGAGRLKQMWYITITSIAPTISILLILRIGSLLSVGYEKIILLYSGSTYETADVISTYVYRQGLVNADFSFGTAIDLFNSVVAFVLVFTANAISKRVGETSLL